MEILENLDGDNFFLFLLKKLPRNFILLFFVESKQVVFLGKLREVKFFVYVEISTKIF